MENLEKRVLIADSDENFVSEIKNILIKNGCSVIGTAGDGFDAVSESLEKQPEIVFLKKEMEFVDGFRAAACLREKGFFGLVVIVAEDYSADAAQNAISAGADGIITKPVTEKFLIPWLLTKLKRTGEKRELFNEKNKLLSELENKRIESEALGIIASSMKITIAEAKKLLDKKAKAKGMTSTEVAKLIASGFENQ